MSAAVFVKSYEAPPVSRREILRYAGAREGDKSVEELLESCLSEAIGMLSYRVVYRASTVCITGDVCDFPEFSVASRELARNLSGSGAVILFAATVGTALDRAIKRNSIISPSRALMLSAIGAERCEALCNAFCEDMWSLYGRVRPRFSPGFGGVPLELQRDIFSLLSPEKHIGLCLNESLLMSPSKSVTAFLGVKSYEIS